MNKLHDFLIRNHKTTTWAAGIVFLFVVIRLADIPPEWASTIHDLLALLAAGGLIASKDADK